jgi:hypothetical protein
MHPVPVLEPPEEKLDASLQTVRRAPATEKSLIHVDLRERRGWPGFADGLHHEGGGR